MGGTNSSWLALTRKLERNKGRGGGTIALDRLRPYLFRYIKPAVVGMLSDSLLFIRKIPAETSCAGEIFLPTLKYTIFRILYIVKVSTVNL